MESLKLRFRKSRCGSPASYLTINKELCQSPHVEGRVSDFIREIPCEERKVFVFGLQLIAIDSGLCRGRRRGRRENLSRDL
jgi:hypothetical protein